MRMPGIRLLDSKVEFCVHCNRRVYQLPETGLWYDLQLHVFMCRSNLQDGLHVPKGAAK